MTVLASQAFEGRATGRVGERLAARYLADSFASMGLDPLPRPAASPAGTLSPYFQPFDFTSGVRLGEASELVWPGHETLVLNGDWRPLGFSESGAFGPFAVVFGGYGFAAPAFGEIPAVDFYGDVDVTGAWLVVLRDWPDHAEAPERRHWGRYAGLRYKAILARERGAAGLIVIQRPPTADGEGDGLVPLRFDGTAGSAGIPVLTLREDRLDQMLAASGHTTRGLRDTLDAGEPVPAFQIPELELRAAVELHDERLEGVNVLARLGAGDPERPALVIGAHYDHLGRAARRGSLARAEERADVHYGADDNASGVAALLEIARELRARLEAGTLDAKRDVVFAAWSGEELGLLGSHAFVARAARRGVPEVSDPHGANPHRGDPHTEPPRRDLRDLFVANLNLDMVGRLEETLLLQGESSSPAWAGLVERAAAAAPIPHQLQGDALLPTDASSFVTRGVPVLSGFTGAHGEYHTPRDTADRINYAGLDTVAGFFAELAAAVVEDAVPLEFVAPTRGEGGGDPGDPHANRPMRLRAYLGTVPDYASQAVTGMALAAVVSEGPAERAGLRGGDVVTRLAGQPVRNVYDYTFAIESLRPGAAIEVEVSRGGETLRFQLTPTARQ